MAAVGSSVSCPSGVRAQSSGIFLPWRSRQRIMPLPAVVKAMSSTTGKSPPVGAAKPQGFVPTRGEDPPQGAISAPALVIAMPMQSDSSASRGMKGGRAKMRAVFDDAHAKAAGPWLCR